PGILGVQGAESFQGRQRGVAVAEALHPAPFLVHADQLRARRGFTDGLREFGHLLPGCEVPGKQDDAGTGRVLEPVAFAGAEFGAGGADDEHGCQRVKRAMDSTWAVCGNMSMTPAASRVQPCSLARWPASRASDPGWQLT